MTAPTGLPRNAGFPACATMAVTAALPFCYLVGSSVRRWLRPVPPAAFMRFGLRGFIPGEADGGGFFHFGGGDFHGVADDFCCGGDEFSISARNGEPV